jgi:hypothetical protein
MRHWSCSQQLVTTRAVRLAHLCLAHLCLVHLRLVHLRLVHLSLVHLSLVHLRSAYSRWAATREAAAACPPAASFARANPPCRAVGSQATAPAWARRVAPHARVPDARTVAPFRGPAPRPGLPRCGSPRRCCSIAPNRDSRDRGARRCCRACPRGAPRSLADRRRRYRHMRPATGNTTQLCKSSA